MEKTYYLACSYHRGVAIAHTEEERDKIIEAYEDLNCYEIPEDIVQEQLGCDLDKAWTYIEDGVTWYYNHYLPEANWFFYIWEEEVDPWLLDYAGIH